MGTDDIMITRCLVTCEQRLRTIIEMPHYYSHMILVRSVLFTNISAVLSVLSI